MLNVFNIRLYASHVIKQLLWLAMVIGWTDVSLAGEPVYNSQSLSAWLVSHESTPKDDSRGQQLFVDAISAMGTNALPGLITQLDPPISTNQLYILSAIEACRILGPAAQPAIPALAKRLAQGIPSAAEALHAIGPETIPALAETLISMPPTCPAQYRIAKVLGRYGTQARSAVPQLVQTMDKSEFNSVRSAAARALGTIAGELAATEPQSKEVLQAKAALLIALSTKAEWLQCDIAEALGKFKESASEAAPILSRLLHEKRQKGQVDAIYRNLEEALGTIDPKGLYRGGGTS